MARHSVRYDGTMAERSSHRAPYGRYIAIAALGAVASVVALTDPARLGDTFGLLETRVRGLDATSARSLVPSLVADVRAALAEPLYAIRMRSIEFACVWTLVVALGAPFVARRSSGPARVGFVLGLLAGATATAYAVAVIAPDMRIPSPFILDGWVERQGPS